MLARQTTQEKVQLRSLLDQYLKHWGPLDWRPDLARVRVQPNQVFGSALLALSAIETDSLNMFRKLHTAGVDRDASVREFILCWLGEEAEHGRALLALSRAYGCHDELSTRRDRKGGFREIFAWPTLFAGRVVSGPLQATYCSLGSAQELVALKTYQAMARHSGDPYAAAVLERIAFQESHHMRFYHHAAEIFLRRSGASVLTSAVLNRLWRPPGVDVLGLRRWTEVFAFLLADSVYRDQLRNVDRMIRNLSGLDSVHLMEPFLSEIGYGSGVFNAQSPDWISARSA